MCGRFVSAGSPDRIAAYFDSVLPTEVVADSLGENYNVAPTQDIYALVGTGGAARLDAFHWGLVPSWAKDRKIGSKMINARAETLAEKPSFKTLFRSKRCIVPMDGFYEWKAGVAGGPANARGKLLKQPMYIHRADGDPLAVAGLWSRWKDPDDAEGRYLHSATVITTAANRMMSPIHDRMPAILPASKWLTWLDPANDDLDALAQLLIGCDEDVLEMYEVSTEVNNVRNNRPDLITPVA
jgi:putative SOS response-associated peptidase YedK